MKTGIINDDGRTIEAWEDQEQLEPEDTRSIRDYLRNIINRLDKLERMLGE